MKLVASAAALGTLLSVTPAGAEVHLHPALEVAGLVRVRDGATLRGAVALRGEMLFGDFASPRLGGFVEGRLTGSAETSGAMGLSLALPLAKDGGPAFVISSGAALHDRDRAVVPAGLARVFFGLRTTPSANSVYEISVGVFGEARWAPRDGTVDALLGVSVDLYALTLPFVYLASGLR